MRLTGLSYKTANWELKEIEFDEVSLIVGKNATGKTRTLEVIHLLYEIICQKKEIAQPAKWTAKFCNDSDDLVYEFETAIKNDPYVLNEKMTVNGEIVFERSTEHVKIKNIVSGQFEEGNPPTNKLVIHVLRDIKKYPYIEAIVRWAEQSYGFKFSNVYPRYGQPNVDYGLLSTVDHISKLLLHLEPEDRNIIISEILEVGFAVETINLFVNSPDYIDIAIIESNVEGRIHQAAMSQGLFRSLSILIFVEYLVVKKSTATIIIDDLCEGLDYERATKLGSLLFKKCLDNNIQLIATSNDMFLMDVVDLKYWNVLQRNGHVVTSVNAKNHTELFDDFKFTGLSNFDFFASDYIAQNL